MSGQVAQQPPGVHFQHLGHFHDKALQSAAALFPLCLASLFQFILSQGSHVFMDCIFVLQKVQVSISDISQVLPVNIKTLWGENWVSNMGILVVYTHQIKVSSCLRMHHQQHQHMEYGTPWELSQDFSQVSLYPRYKMMLQPAHPTIHMPPAPDAWLERQMGIPAAIHTQLQGESASQEHSNQFPPPLAHKGIVECTVRATHTN